MEPAKGVEPLTCGLRNRCSASELRRLEVGYGRRGGCSQTKFKIVSWPCKPLVSEARRSVGNPKGPACTDGASSLPRVYGPTGFAIRGGAQAYPRPGGTAQARENWLTVRLQLAGFSSLYGRAALVIDDRPGGTDHPLIKHRSEGCRGRPLLGIVPGNHDGESLRNLLV